ncbi:MAG: short-chain dehydrogenase [Candidatus Angelobacter sp. Gp1-AA117]|nr:MAG: short-chain dehydrogenase [Candidatus Angelobacter sp. Gp1-AA117]
MTERQSLKGHVAVITGASHGIGLALAEALAREGCDLVVAARKAASLTDAVRQLSLSKCQFNAIGCDVRSAADVQNLFDTVRKRHSRLDILINNAGVAHALAPVEELQLDAWKEVIDTNLTGTFLCTQAALPLMHAGGTIVNNLSVAALQPFEGMAAYNASKHGAMGFTNVLRQELRKKGIRVLALIPGATDTAIWDQFWPDAPRERMLSPATVAEAVVHVLTLPANATIEEIRLGPTAGVL